MSKKKDDKETQTIVRVVPHILQKHELANVFIDSFTQTSITFHPGTPVYKAVSLLKANLLHNTMVLSINDQNTLTTTSSKFDARDKQSMELSGTELSHSQCTSEMETEIDVQNDIEGDKKNSICQNIKYIPKTIEGIGKPNTQNELETNLIAAQDELLVKHVLENGKVELNEYLGLDKQLAELNAIQNLQPEEQLKNESSDLYKIKEFFEFDLQKPINKKEDTSDAQESIKMEKHEPENAVVTLNDDQEKSSKSAVKEIDDKEVNSNETHKDFSEHDDRVQINVAEGFNQAQGTSTVLNSQQYENDGLDVIEIREETLQSDKKLLKNEMTDLNSKQKDLSPHDNKKSADKYIELSKVQYQYDTDVVSRSSNFGSMEPDLSDLDVTFKNA